MLHKTLETKAQTLTDKGEFVALAAAFSVDRMGDQIVRGAFAKTIAAWQASDKDIPLHYDHGTAAEDIVGAVNPASMKETEEGLLVTGQLDLKGSATAREAWRSIKNNVLSLSFGYLATKERKRKDGVNELLEIDLFEVSVVPAPANADTKFLSYKGAEKTLEAETASAVEVSEAWKLVMKDTLPKERKRPTGKPVKALARFPDVQTEEDFKGLLFHDKLSVYYAGQDDGIDLETGNLSQKAIWASDYIDTLPDEAFLYVEDTDEPDKKRLFPVRDESGKVDVHHLRNIFARLPKSDLAGDARDEIARTAKRMLKRIKAEQPEAKQTSAVEDGSDEEPETAKSAPQDPLVKEAWELVVRNAYGGPPPKRLPEPTPEPEPEPVDPATVQREAWTLALKTRD